MAEESWSNSPPSAKRMAEASWSNSPPSAKHHRGEASGKEPLVVDDDVPVPGQKQDYTVPLKVDTHLKEPLDVICTSNPDEANKRIREIRRRLGGMLSRSIGVDVEYTRKTNLRKLLQFNSYAWRISSWYTTSPRQPNGKNIQF